MNSNYKVIDLFSGCGGSALGFKNMGFDIRVAVDNNEIAGKSFEANFKDCKVIKESICDVDGKYLMKAGNLSKKDKIVLIACPPCQGFSNARRNSQRRNDPRNKLIFEVVKIIKQVKPVAFVMENVPGLAKGIGKNILEDVLGDIKEMGYKLKYDVIDTADYGVPQHRRRVVIIGIKGKKEPVFLSQTHADPAKKESTLKVWMTVKNTIGDLPKIEAGETYNYDKLHRSASLAEINLQRIKNTPQNGGDRTSWPEKLILTCHKNTTGHKDVYGRMRWDAPSPTMTGGCGMITKGRFGHPEQDRAISLREAARLQTFPDDFIFIGNFGDIAKQIGNAVPPRLGELTAKAILESIGD
ncbi:MAG: DNA cytosine methyltransferase [Candidatus Shapirobacteria bacterium]|nr:DNA cytosine methyltransferase [Candidatus Shapirobacteria bacterium]